MMETLEDPHNIKCSAKVSDLAYTVQESIAVTLLTI